MLCYRRLEMQQRAAAGGHLILHSDCLHFLRKTAFVLIITGQGFCVGQRVHCTCIPLLVLLPQHCQCCASLCHDQFAACFAWSSGFCISCSPVSLLWFVLMVINCVGGHLPLPGCFSVCLEGTGYSVGLQRMVVPPSEDHRTRLLFGLSGRHWAM